VGLVLETGDRLTRVLKLAKQENGVSGIDALHRMFLMVRTIQVPVLNVETPFFRPDCSDHVVRKKGHTQTNHLFVAGSYFPISLSYFFFIRYCNENVLRVSESFERQEQSNPRCVYVSKRARVRRDVQIVHEQDARASRGGRQMPDVSRRL
jgi:hypothetical protein